MTPPSPASARRLAAFVATTCAAGLALVLPTGAGAFTWQFPVTPLQAGPSGSDSADVAVAPDGTTTIVFARRYDSGGLAGSWIMAATRPAGQGDFIYSDVSIPVGAAGYLGGDNSPRIAVSPDGTTTVVWYDGSADRIWAATRPPGQSSFPDPTQTPPQRLSDIYSLFPEVTAADDGSVTVVWTAADATTTPVSAWRVQGAIRRPGHTGFPAPADLSVPRNNSSSLFPRVAGAPDGTTTAVWSRLRDTGVTGNTIQAATRRPGQPGFDAPQDVSSPNDNAQAPDVAFGADGQTTIVWQGQGMTSETVEAAIRQPGASTFDASQLIADSIGEPAAQVAYAPDGQATVVWGFGEIFSSTRAPNSSDWGIPESISGAAADIYPRIAVAADGRATVAWLTGWSTPTAGVQAATRPGGSSDWSSPTTLDGNAGTGQLSPYPTPAIAVAPDGRATVAWTTKALRPGTTPAQGVVLTIDSDATRYGLEVKTDGAGSGTVTSSPPGISCGAICSSTFPLSTPVVLTANPSAGSRFSGWGGACSGTASTCTVRIFSDRSVTATFSKNPPEPGPSPSNRFTTTPSTVRGSSIVTRIRVPGAGKITQRATYSPRRASALATRTACTASRTVTRAGTYTLVCRLNPAARAQRTQGTLRLRLRTTFTPTGGTGLSRARTVVLRSPTLPVVG